MDNEEYKELVEEIVDFINQESPLSWNISEDSIIAGLEAIFKNYYELENSLDRIRDLV